MICCCDFNRFPFNIWLYCKELIELIIWDDDNVMIFNQLEHSHYIVIGIHQQQWWRLTNKMMINRLIEDICLQESPILTFDRRNMIRDGTHPIQTKRRDSRQQLANSLDVKTMKHNSKLSDPYIWQGSMSEYDPFKKKHIYIDWSPVNVVCFFFFLSGVEQTTEAPPGPPSR